MVANPVGLCPRGRVMNIVLNIQPFCPSNQSLAVSGSIDV